MRTFVHTNLLFLFLWVIGLVGCDGNTVDLRILRSVQVAATGTEDFNVAGGELLTVTGEGFTANAKVFVSGKECVVQGVPTSQQIQCLTPALEGAGLKDLVVRDGLLSKSFVKKIRYNLVLGQQNFTDRVLLGMRKGLNNPYTVVRHGTKLLLADAGNHRILIWNNTPTANFSAPDIVLGQLSFDSKYRDVAGGGISASSFYSPYHVATDGTRVFVSDAGNHRILIWTTFPTTNGQPADLVIGQTDFTSGLQNRDGSATVTALGLRSPRGIFYDGSRLYVVDSGNNRVLIWNALPTQNGQAADLVLGQADFTTRVTTGPNTAPCGGVSGRNLCAMSSPTAVYVTTSRVYVTDNGSNRVLVWTSLPTVNRQPANFVIGQSTPNGTGVNAGPNTAPCGGVTGLNKCSLNGPRYVSEIGTSALAIADMDNNRVLIYSPIPSAGNPAASFVLGQNDFFTNTASSGGVSATTLSKPSSVAVFGNELWITDSANQRLLKWNSLPVSNAAAADIVTGQKNFTSASGNYYDIPSSYLTLNEPYTGSLRGGRLFVMDRANNRVLIWNSLPKVNNQMPDLVLGQADFVSNVSSNGPSTSECGGVAGVNRCSLAGAIGMATDGTRLVISDRNAHRILIWNQTPTRNQQPADLVLGQPDFTSSTENNGPNTVSCGGAGGTNACSLSSPLGVSLDGDKLLVADYGNHRILIWNQFPTQNQQPADLVLGQPNFLSRTARAAPSTAGCGGVSGTTACSLVNILDVHSKDGKVIGVDTGDNRVLVWSQFPTQNQQPADVVLGQSDMLSNQSGTSDSRFQNPSGALVMDGKLYVVDRENNRILMWPLSSLANGAPAKAVFGQMSFTQGARFSDTQASAKTFADPVLVSGEDGLLAVGEQFGSRVILRPAIPDFEAE